MPIRWILASFSLGAALCAQVTRSHFVTLQNWQTPLYWQPSPAEADPSIRPPSADATTPVGSLVFVAMTPCRVVDTRAGMGFTGAFGSPSLVGGLPVRTFPIQSGSCSIPSIAQAYSFNVTVVPQGTLGFLTVYPATAGAQPAPPNVSTLNSLQGYVGANAAIVPAGSDGHGGVDVYASNPTDKRAHRLTETGPGRNVRGKTMTIELKPEHQQTIDLAIESGAYHDPGEVLDQAFEIIREQLHLEDWMRHDRDAIAAHIATGFAQAQRGELMDGEEAIEMLHQRRAERLKSQG